MLRLSSKKYSLFTKNVFLKVMRAMNIQIGINRFEMDSK
jgi:hypothetical protein